MSTESTHLLADVNITDSISTIRNLAPVERNSWEKDLRRRYEQEEPNASNLIQNRTMPNEEANHCGRDPARLSA